MQLRMSTVLDDLTTRLAFRRRIAAQRRAAYRRLQLKDWPRSGAPARAALDTWLPRLIQTEPAA